ncbi:MAG: hypothetical protein KKG33_08460 [candidate division Zixibacteria bacterium]|nr:hypothetical protein [candidate division Zixibacteria bacterium]MBU1471882.1 hypothetical protein [candidate division Zixibacteria bacterium]MBU2625578.1 hypothetical protein [candidate division Zixibacteria bacterium]
MKESTDIMESLERIRLKYEALRQIAVKAASGSSLSDICQAALENAVAIVEVEAGSLTLDRPGNLIPDRFSAGSDEFAAVMTDLQARLISMLRDDFSVENLFLTFDKNGPHSLFSYPLMIGGKNIGTISGVTSGKRKLAVEEDFIEAISSQLALALSTVTGADAGDVDIKKAKVEAVVETAVTINHEINNPLTAVLGNVQLLLVDKDKMDAKTVKMLQAIEVAALRIREVTRRLMDMVEPQVTEYTTGIKMVDIEKSSRKSNQDDSQ